MEADVAQSLQALGDLIRRHEHDNIETVPLKPVRIALLKIIDDATVLTTGDGKLTFAVPSEMSGYNLTNAQAFVSTVSSSGTPTIQIANVTDSVDMLTTKITIDASEFTSYTAATPSVIDTTKDDVATGDLLRIDVDVAGTGAKGLGVILTFSPQ